MTTQATIPADYQVADMIKADPHLMSNAMIAAASGGPDASWGKAIVAANQRNEAHAKASAKAAKLRAAFYGA